MASAPAKPVVSIIVPTYQRPDDLARCLRSITQTVRLPHEVIAVAVADDAPTQTFLKSANVKTIVQPTRGGCVQAMNLGLRSAVGDYLMQINDDCELLPHSVANAVRFLAVPAHVAGRIGQASRRQRADSFSTVTPCDGDRRTTAAADSRFAG